MAGRPLPVGLFRTYIQVQQSKDAALTAEEIEMAECEVCGNDYDKVMEINIAGKTHVFDSFECAIHRLAPRCARCECRIVGHGVEADDVFYCSAHCANEVGVGGLTDRI